MNPVPVLGPLYDTVPVLCRSWCRVGNRNGELLFNDCGQLCFINKQYYHVRTSQV